ncbi:conserved hypothetical protein [Segniliparus rotundus DSM 44985]|uniref:FG-GAP repeat protein n=1 Tax=Segniliparus rotundus (strain ATCC BAA-972 / CDC 1076 / CIP 108378 / DSM 44985 / JCM 13578) TaxID=640132 RepID=D6ZFN5_SEGRD|nr:hypothetical protein [Segniliparus rotundus]ADG97759.1 conserved hypothetical protein [Segniliparus rotundus DSM 44985]
MPILRALGGAAVLALLAAGCGEQPNSPGPAASSQLIRLAGLPDCGKAIADDPKLDCAIKSSDSAKLMLEAIGPRPYTIKVFDASGAQRQVFVQQDPDPDRAGLPEFKDLDGDGRDEVLIPTSGGGGGGRVYEVWHASGGAQTYADAGQIFGLGLFNRTTDGAFFAQYGASGTGAMVFDFYRFVGVELVEVLRLDVRRKIDDVSGEVVGVTCVLSGDGYPEGARGRRDGALRAAGLDPETARQRYCAEPWVQSVFRHDAPRRRENAGL